MRKVTWQSITIPSHIRRFQIRARDGMKDMLPQSINKTQEASLELENSLKISKEESHSICRSSRVTNFTFLLLEDK